MLKFGVVPRIFVSPWSWRWMKKWRMWYKVVVGGLERRIFGGFSWVFGAVLEKETWWSLNDRTHRSIT
jgi:hypothetical protein